MVEQGLTGRYVYCVIDSGEPINFGRIGIDGSEVYTIPHSDISAVVHNCLPKAYESKDEKVTIDYAQKHNHVVALALDRFDTVIPSRFNTIIKEDGEPNEAVQKWLGGRYSDLKRKLSELKGRREYSVQVYTDGKKRLIDKERFLQDILDKNEGIAGLKKKMESAHSPGQAYLHKQMFENAVKKELEGRLHGITNEVLALAEHYGPNIKIEKKVDGKKMLLNVSCLVQKEEAARFREELEKIDGFNNLTVRITGPWAPYSFV